MLVKYEFELEIKEEINYKIYNWGSLFQGLLMENIPAELAEQFHNMRYNPYSQYVYYKNDKYFWCVSSIGKDIYEAIFENFLLKVQTLKIKHKNLEINILNKTLISKIELKELFKKWYFNETVNNRILINFKTPASYKVNNTYQIVPNTDYILGNLVNKWNYFNNENKINDEILDEYKKKVYIERYNLKSVKFGVEGININSFIGTIGIKIKANETMSNILNMLLEFGEYVGLGIKSSMGMGGIEIVKD